MSTKDRHIDHDELIQRYLDGELDGQERSRAEALLAEDEGLRRRLDMYRQLGRLLGEAVDMENVEGLLDMRLETILHRSEEEGEVSFRERLKVSLEEFFFHRKRVWVPMAACLVAAISTIALVLALTAPPSETVEPEQERWSRVTSVSLGANSSMVLEMEDDTGTKSTVLWVLGESETPVNGTEIQEPEGQQPQGPPPQDAATED
jgi:anti-sigma factor RsiW